MEELRQELLRLTAPVVQRFALDLIDLELKGSKHNLLVRVIADTAGGISVDACADLSRALAEEFELRNAIPGRYRLEVSSPGIDRPLRSPRDFERNLGRQVAVRWRRDEVNEDIEGIIETVSETEVGILVHGENRRIPFAGIEYGKIKIKW